jgi:hypothetical protein
MARKNCAYRGRLDSQAQLSDDILPLFRTCLIAFCEAPISAGFQR